MSFLGRGDASAKYQPFSERLAGKPFKDVLFEGVPPHLEQPLGDWIMTALTDDLARRVCLRLRLPRYLAADLPLKVRPSQYLEVVDAMLSFGLADVPIPLRGPTESLMDIARGHSLMSGVELYQFLVEMLAEGSSAYRINASADGLERRVEQAVTDAAFMAMNAAKTAGRAQAARRLNDAWSKTYARRPDPGGAYSDSVKAVEEVACPLFLPNDPAPTLGKVRANLDQGRACYELVIYGSNASPAPIDAVVEMVALLWHGQRERHGGGPTTVPITQESAEAAFHLATTLVHWFSTGAVRRKP